MGEHLWLRVAEWFDAKFVTSSPLSWGKTTLRLHSGKRDFNDSTTAVLTPSGEAMMTISFIFYLTSKVANGD
jgi:hypothetical protein